jgi:hypothetical protein
MHHQRGIENAGFVERGVHVAHVVGTDAVIRAARRGHGLPDDGIAHVRDAVLVVLPGRAQADAVLGPSLDRTARRRTLVGLARPFVVAPRQLVQHARADDGGPILLGAQEIHHGRQGKPGACALAPLVENHRRLDQRHIDQQVGQRNQRRLVKPVAQVDAVGEGVEPLAGGFLCAGFQGGVSG